MVGKDLLTSKTVIGSLMVVVAVVAERFDVLIDAPAWTADLVTLFGAAFAVYGRFMAVEPIRSILGLEVRKMPE